MSRIPLTPKPGDLTWGGRLAVHHRGGPWYEILEPDPDGRWYVSQEIRGRKDASAAYRARRDELGLTPPPSCWNCGTVDGLRVQRVRCGPRTIKETVCAPCGLALAPDDEPADDIEEARPCGLCDERATQEREHAPTCPRRIER